MKAAIALAGTLLLAGCASDPYTSTYGGYTYYDSPGYYSSGQPYYGSSYYDGYGYPYSYGYPYPYSYYGAPALGGSVYFEDRDGDRRRWDGDDRGDRARDGWRDRDGRSDRGPDRDDGRPERAEVGAYRGEALAPGAGRAANAGGRPPGEQRSR